MEESTRKKSRELFQEAQKLIPGGVNSPVRAFKAVGGNPIFIQRAAGSKIYDVDGHEFIDYVCSWGPMILGHAHPQVIDAIRQAAEKGTSYGAPTELEVELARMITKAVPSVEMVRMVSSGTEATMSALRLARAFTKRDKILKFEGCYHGHSDSLLVKAGSGVATLGIPDSPGVPSDLAKLTLNVPFNNLEAVKEVFKSRGEEIAAVILEPVVGNAGVIVPKKDFLPGLREISQRYGSLLIFDEVITGFRLSFGGAQALYGIKPDLTTFGKIIGGGLPVGAYGGRLEIMEMIAPSGPVYQAGTLSGNPLAMTAGLETLKILARPGVYDELDKKAGFLCQGMAENARELGIPTYFSRIGSMFSMFFTAVEVTDYDSAKTSNTARFGRYFLRMLEEGINIAPSQFEAGFVSLAHSQGDLEKTISAGYQALAALKEEMT